MEFKTSYVRAKKCKHGCENATHPTFTTASPPTSARPHPHDHSAPPSRPFESAHTYSRSPPHVYSNEVDHHGDPPITNIRSTLCEWSLKPPRPLTTRLTPIRIARPLTSFRYESKCGQFPLPVKREKKMHQNGVICTDLVPRLR